MEENHFVEAKPEHEKALDLASPCCRWVIRERSTKRERSPPAWSTGSGQQLSGGEALRSASSKLSVRLRNYDEANLAESIELLSKSGKNRDRRMENEPPVAQPDYRHADGNPDQAGLPAELMLGAPKIRVVLD